jgi:hypothetical protein
LLDQRIQAIFDVKPVVVGFRIDYDDGRWVTRTARTAKSWFVTEKILPREIAVDTTDQRGKPVTKHVDVRFLLPKKPHMNKLAIIIDGPNIGDFGTVMSKSRATNKYKIQLLNSAVNLYLPEDALCRLWDE